MRLGDADREQLYERLKQHAAAGRLDIPELERRVALVAAAQTEQEAAAALADLPPLPAAAPAAATSRSRWGRGHGDADTPQADWAPTAERFRDPKTNRIRRVWVDAAGGRHYVDDSA